MVENVEKNVMDKIWDSLNSMGKILEERVFSPMYFYFIISRILWNRKFVYVLLFVDQTGLIEEKLNLMSSFYSFDGWWSFFGMLFGILLWPLCTTWLAIQPLTWLSNKVTKYYEEKQQVKRLEIHSLQFQEKLLKAYEEKQQQEKEARKNMIEYKANPTFNDRIDNEYPSIEIWEMTGFPVSEALYHTDYQAYISLLENYKDEINNNLHFLLQDDQKKQELKEILRDEIIQEWKDEEASLEEQERRKYQE